MRETRVHHSYIKKIIMLSLMISIILFFYFYRKNLFSKTQGSKSESLESGYGYYGPAIAGPCVTRDGCGKGQRVNTRTCIVNAVTLKGCIDDDGNMTMADIQEREACYVQCIQSMIHTQDKYEINSPVVFSGVNRLYDPETGIDYTDDYIESYDDVEQKYIFKKCI